MRRSGKGSKEKPTGWVDGASSCTKKQPYVRAVVAACMYVRGVGCVVACSVYGRTVMEELFFRFAFLSLAAAGHRPQATQANLLNNHTHTLTSPPPSRPWFPF